MALDECRPYSCINWQEEVTVSFCLSARLNERTPGPDVDLLTDMAWHGTGVSQCPKKSSTPIQPPRSPLGLAVCLLVLHDSSSTSFFDEDAFRPPRDRGSDSLEEFVVALVVVGDDDLYGLQDLDRRFVVGTEEDDNEEEEFSVVEEKEEGVVRYFWTTKTSPVLVSASVLMLVFVALPGCQLFQ